MSDFTTWILLIALVAAIALPLGRAFALRRRGSGAALPISDGFIFGAYLVLASGVLCYWTLFNTPRLPSRLVGGAVAQAPAGEGGSAADALPQACAEARNALTQLAELSGGAFRQAEPGELLVVTGVWDQIPSEQRSELAMLVARAAACPNGDPREQIVTIREMPSGEVLAEGVPFQR